MEYKPRETVPASQDSAAPAADGKLVISGVVTHAKLVAAIAARNPIIARRHKTTKPSVKPAKPGGRGGAASR